MRPVVGILIGLGLALAAFDATVLALKITHREEACICVYKVGR